MGTAAQGFSDASPVTATFFNSGDNVQTASAILLIITGFGIIGFWSMHIIKGGLPQGARTIENGGYISFHIFTELLTGVLCITGGIAVLTNRPWGTILILTAAGMLLYTSINSLAWSKVRNKPTFAVMFIVPAIIAIFTVIYLLINSL